MSLMIQIMAHLARTGRIWMVGSFVSAGAMSSSCGAKQSIDHRFLAFKNIFNHLEVRTAHGYYFPPGNGALRNAKIQLLKDIISAKVAETTASSPVPAAPSVATAAADETAAAHPETAAAEGSSPEEVLSSDPSSPTARTEIDVPRDLGNSCSSSSLDTEMIESGWRYDEKEARKAERMGAPDDVAETLPMESGVTWPPKPWVPKSDLTRWTTTRHSQASLVISICTVVVSCVFKYLWPHFSCLWQCRLQSANHLCHWTQLPQRP